MRWNNVKDSLPDNGATCAVAIFENGPVYIATYAFDRWLVAGYVYLGDSWRATGDLPWWIQLPPVPTTKFTVEDADKLMAELRPRIDNMQRCKPNCIRTPGHDDECCVWVERNGGRL